MVEIVDIIGRNVPSPPTYEADDMEPAVTQFSLRLPTHVHLAASVAAARANLSMNQWFVNVLEAASNTAHAAALISEFRERGIDDAELRTEITTKVLQLIDSALKNVTTETFEIGDVVSKLVAQLESLEGARAIKENRLK